MNSISEFRKKGDITQEVLASKMTELKSPDDERVYTGYVVSHFETGRTGFNLYRSRLIVSALNALGIECSLDDVFPPEEKAA